MRITKTTPYTQQAGRSGLQLTAITVAAVLSGIGIAGSYSGTELVVVSRFLMMLYAGVLAFATPWAMFPLTPLYLYQATNPTPAALIRHLADRLRLIIIPACALLITVPLWALLHAEADNRGFLMITATENLIAALSLTLFAAYRYLRIGPVSQQWQEGKLGQSLLQGLEESGKSTGVPAGSVPTILVTVTVSALGMLSVVLGAWLQGTTGFMLNAAGPLLLGFAGLFGWMRATGRADVYFYHAHAFYAELFRNPGGRADGGRDPLPYEALYWVPVTLRTMVWSMLRQMDRKVPVGRLVITGIVVYWMMLYSGFRDPIMIAVAPIILILAKNALLLRMGNPAFTPPRFQQQLGSSQKWFWARVFMGLRWSFPLGAGLALAGWLSPVVHSNLVYLWIAGDLLLVLVAAAYLNRKLYLRLRYQFN